MAFTQNKDGGYCPKCDTITYTDNEFPIPTFHCAECGHSTEGFSICLKCNPQTYEVCGYNWWNAYHGSGLPDCDRPISVVGIDKVLVPSVFEIEIWNKAIEAAAKLFPYGEWEEINNAEKIRKLKR